MVKYVALSEAVKEVIIQLLGIMKISKYQAAVRVENIGAILWPVTLPPHHTPSSWISCTSMLMSKLKMELVRYFLLRLLKMTAKLSPKT